MFSHGCVGRLTSFLVKKADSPVINQLISLVSGADIALLHVLDVGTVAGFVVSRAAGGSQPARGAAFGETSGKSQFSSEF